MQEFERVECWNKDCPLKNKTIRGCYCLEDQGAGYTFSDEHGDCDVCIEAKKECRICHPRSGGIIYRGEEETRLCGECGYEFNDYDGTETLDRCPMCNPEVWKAHVEALNKRALKTRQLYDKQRWLE